MNQETKDLIFGKDPTERVVSCEPGPKDTCVLFIQNEQGQIVSKSVPLSRWILFTEQHSPKMRRLEGDQPFKWIMEYESESKYDEVLKACRMKRLENHIARDPKEAFKIISGVTLYKGMKVKDVSVLSFDLEHTYGIGDNLKRDGKLLLISNTYRNSSGEITKRLFAYDEFDCESDMIDSWCTWVREMDPSVLIGHNVFGHDFRVLRFAANLNRTNLFLGRDGSELRFDRRVSLKRKDGSQAYEFFNAHVYGREIVDTFFLALTYDTARVYESYGLKQIIKQEGLEKNHRTHYDASKILDNYLIPAEWVKIKAYCEDDSDDAVSLWDLMIPSFFYATQSIPRSLQQVINSATGGQINGIMVRGYLQQGHSLAVASPSAEYEGAISFGVPGNHKNVLRFDVASLYPSLIRQFNIGPGEKKDPKGLFLRMMNYFTEERLENKRLAKETKDRFYDDLQSSQKIFINSGYGFLGAGRLNYNNPAGAAEVTRRGREVLKHGILFLTGNPYEGPVDQEGNELDDAA